MNPEFHRSLRKNPENFFWLVSEDDGLEDRSEEQFYLDFYYGTEWCYNSNPNAISPPSCEGMFWWNNGVEHTMSFTCPGVGWVKGKLYVWWTNGERNTVAMECPGKGWWEGRSVSPEQARKMSESGSGSVWWTNGEVETRSKTCPGEGWVSGRKYSAEGKVSWTDGVNNTYSVECPGPEWRRGKTMSEEERLRCGDYHRGKKYGKRDPSVGKKISEAQRGRKFTEGHKKALSEARAGIPMLTCEVCGKEIRGGIGNLNQHLRKHQREE
jgi:hypothetical protein